MIGQNMALGDQINQQLLANADALGLQYNIWRQATHYPDGRVVPMEDRGSATQNHMDHVHARVAPGPAALGGVSAPVGAPANAPAATWAGPTGLPAPGTVPSSGGPMAPGMPGSPFLGAPTGPGVGAGAGTTPIGGLAPPGGSGGGGAVGLTGGGAIGLGMQAGGMALDAMAPGAGQAAQTVVKLGSRAIEFGSQAAGIGASGVMETLLPTGGSELANNNWATKIASGFAGMGAALPNMAGNKSPQELGGQPAQGDQNTTNQKNYNYDVKIDAAARDPGGIARSLEYHTSAAAMAPGM